MIFRLKRRNSDFLRRFIFLLICVILVKKLRQVIK